MKYPLPSTLDITNERDRAHAAEKLYPQGARKELAHMIYVCMRWLLGEHDVNPTNLYEMPVVDRRKEERRKNV